MVFDSSPSSSHPAETPGHRPDPLDRFAAAVVDLVAIFLLSGVFLAPVQKAFQEVRVTGQFEELPWLLLSALFIVGGVSVLYQGISLAWQGRSFGKKIFGLRVVSLWSNEKPTWGAAFLRSLGWGFSFVALGFPFLAVWTEPRSRALYDRISDLRVVSDRRAWGRTATSLNPRVRNGVVLALLTLGFILAAQVIWLVRERGRDEDAWLSELRGIGHDSCESVSETLESWSDLTTNRLEVALALFGAGEISKECLETEADLEFSKKEPDSLAYLAKAFSKNDEAEVSDEYLARVCQEASGSVACRFSRLVEIWTQEQWSEADEVFAQLLPEAPLYIKIWAIKHYEKVRNFEGELQLLGEIGPRRELAEFLGTRRAISLWGLHRHSEAREVLEAILPTVEKETRASLASWICYRELLGSCEAARGNICRVFASEIEERTNLTHSKPALITQIRREECLNPSQIVFEDFETREMDRSTKSFLKALDSLRLAKTKKDRRDLLTIALLPKSDRYLSFEAKLRILDANPNAKELGLLRKIWEVSEETSWEWPVLGARLASRYLDLGQASIASDISSRILMKDSRHPEVRKTLVLSLARLGKRQEAWDRARENGGRIPAAASAYDDLVRSLRREFER